MKTFPSPNIPFGVRASGLDDEVHHGLLLFVLDDDQEHFLGEFIVGDLADFQPALLAAAENIYFRDRRESCIQQRRHNVVCFLGTNDCSNHDHN